MNFDFMAIANAPEQGAIAGMPLAELLPPEMMEARPRAVNPYDLESVRAKLAPYEDQLVSMRERAEALSVTDDATAAEATELGVACRKIEKAVEETRAFFKRPALDFGTAVDNLARTFTNKASAAATTLSRKVAAYQNQKKREEQERLRKEQEAAAKLKAELEAKAKETGTDPVQVVMPKAAPTSAPIRTESGKAVVVTKWVCTITNAALVPREYCEPVQKLLNEAMKNGIREIPGCVIEEQSSARFQA